MKLVLYSKPDNGIIEKLENEIFHEKGTVFGYMPADGNSPKPQYTPFWQDLAKKHNAKFVYIDNSKTPTKADLDKNSEINSLAVMGGNVFNLLHNIRTNGYNKIIRKLAEKEDFIYSGFSAGAIIATPNIRIANKEYCWAFGYDENEPNITDTKALGFVDFEILPHFDPELDRINLCKYKNKFETKVEPLTDSNYKIINI
jgi:peptidase E